MQALIFEGIETATLRDVPIPGIRSHEVLIQVKAVGLSDADAQIYRGAEAAEFPLIPGHEFAGVVRDIGERVTTLNVGERVTGDPILGCGTCYFCKIKQPDQCDQLEIVGSNRDGACAEYVVMPETHIYPIGELSFREAAMIAPLAGLIAGVQQIPLPLGAEVLISGAGTRGLVLLQLLKNSGAARVVMLEARANRLALALSLGAQAGVRVDGTESAALRELAPTGFDLALDASGDPQMVARMLPFMRKAGRLGLFGIYPKHATLPLRPYDIARRNLKIYGSFGLRNQFPFAIRLLQQRVIQVAPLLSHAFPFEAFADALQLIQNGDAFKVQLHP